MLTMSFGSMPRSARSARIVSTRPPPTQSTANVTWIALKSEYQLFGRKIDEEKAKMIPTTMTTPSSRNVIVLERESVAEVSAGVSIAADQRRSTGRTQDQNSRLVGSLQLVA